MQRRDKAVAVVVGVSILAVFLAVPQSGDANPIPLALLSATGEWRRVRIAV